jgi:hypothetical protein
MSDEGCETMQQELMDLGVWLPGSRNSAPCAASSGRWRSIVIEELGGIGANEQAYGPVDNHLCPVEVVAQLIEVDFFPDQRTDQSTDLGAQDVDEGAAFPQVDELGASSHRFELR